MAQLAKAPIAAAATTQRQMTAVVVSAGLMQKTVKVRVGYLEWNALIRKKFAKRRYLLVHDPRSSLTTGDVISISGGWRTSKHVHHVVNSILAPFGKPIEERPAVPTQEERLAEREAKYELKKARRSAARRAEHEAEQSRALSEGRTKPVASKPSGLSPREKQEAARAKAIASITKGQGQKKDDDDMAHMMEGFDDLKLEPSKGMAAIGSLHKQTANLRQESASA